MPNESAVRQRIVDDLEGCAVKFKRAVETGTDTEFDRIRELADSASGLDSAGVEAMRLRIDTAKWRPARIAPEKYHDLRIQRKRGP